MNDCVIPTLSEAKGRDLGGGTPEASAQIPRSTLGMTLFRFMLLVLCVACERSVPDPVATAKRPATTDTAVINFLNGLVVTDRSGELQLSSSAMHAIDGDRGTIWTTPPGDVRQDVTMAFPARTRIERLGVSNRMLVYKGRAANRVQFEWSQDGESFQALPAITVPKADDPLLNVTPVDALALRATILGTFGNDTTADVPELLIAGKEIEKPTRGSLNGTWKLNELTARLGENGPRIYGTVDMDPPMLIEGAWDGPYARFAWSRGKQFGVGVLTVDRSGTFLNGLWWFREAIPQFFGTPWFGQKSGSVAAEPSLHFAQASLRDRKSFPVYHLRFDRQGRLLPESEAGIDLVRRVVEANPGLRLRLVANDATGKTKEDRQAIANGQIESLRQAGLDPSRLELSAAGDQYLRDPESMIYYPILHSRIDLEVIEE